MKSIQKLFVLLIIVLVLFGCSHSNLISRSAPIEVELQNFIDSMGVDILTKKIYSDYAVVLGVRSVYTISILDDGKPQYVGSSWGGGDSNGIDITAVTQNSPFIGIMIYRDNIAEQGTGVCQASCRESLKFSL